MSKQSRFFCIGGFLNGSAVKDQADSFVCIEYGKKSLTEKWKFSIKTRGIKITTSVKLQQINKREIGFMTSSLINETDII